MIHAGISIYSPGLVADCISAVQLRITFESTSDMLTLYCPLRVYNLTSDNNGLCTQIKQSWLDLVWMYWVLLWDGGISSLRCSNGSGVSMVILFPSISIISVNVKTWKEWFTLWCCIYRRMDIRLLLKHSTISLLRFFIFVQYLLLATSHILNICSI